MARSKSSGSWLSRHVNDPFVKQAQKDGYRSRAAYKLLEINDKDRLIRPGMRVLDLGSAPGSWSQVLSRLVGSARAGNRQTSMMPWRTWGFHPGSFNDEPACTLLEPSAGAVSIHRGDIAPNLFRDHSGTRPLVDFSTSARHGRRR